MKVTAEIVKKVCVQWQGRTETMSATDADELRAALGRALCVQQSNPTKIIWTACDVFNLPVHRVMSDCRTAEIALARQVAMFLMRERTALTLKQVAEQFPRANGNPRDHGTVMHAVRAVANRCFTDRGFNARVQAVRVALGQQP